MEGQYQTFSGAFTTKIAFLDEKGGKERGIDNESQLFTRLVQFSAANYCPLANYLSDQEGSLRSSWEV